MTLLEPLNDKRCLRLLIAEAKRYAARPEVQAYARRFANLGEFQRHVRQLEQRDDLGDPADGPRLPCEISQRTRFAPSDPNCWERTLLYLAVAELLAPGILRTAASLIMDRGWHTFPVEFRNGLPQIVVLDPIVPPRNAMLATAYRARNIAPTTAKHLPGWFVDMMRNACIDDGGTARLDNALCALRNAVTTGEPIEDLEDLEDLQYVVELAGEDAELWGPRGREAYDEIQQSIRNLSLKLDTSVVSDIVDRVVRTGQKLAPEAIKAALISQFGPAAAIALQGVDLAVTDPDDDSDRKVGTLELALEPSADEADKTRQKHRTRKRKGDRLSPIAQMRRMTLRFR